MPALTRLRDAAAPVAAVLDEVLVERPRVARQVALDDREVAPVHRVRAELRLQPDEAAPASREDEDAGRLLVEPVDDGHVRPLRSRRGASARTCETRPRSVSFSFASVGCVRRPDGLKTAIASSSS